MDYQKLIMEAREAALYSRCRYSGFPVGACVLTENGNIVTGCNIENGAYGPTICAERVAIFNAVSRGESQVIALAIATKSGATCPPCGTCRQVIYELAKGAEIIMEGKEGNLIVKRIEELLPMPFDPDLFLKRGQVCF